MSNGRREFNTLLLKNYSAHASPKHRSRRSDHTLHRRAARRCRPSRRILDKVDLDKVDRADKDLVVVDKVDMPLQGATRSQRTAPAPVPVPAPALGAATLLPGMVVPTTVTEEEDMEGTEGTGCRARRRCRILPVPA
jgi:hypothetical protein